MQNSLTILNVSGNHLESLEDIGILVNLEQLMATDNDLTSMKVQCQHAAIPIAAYMHIIFACLQNLGKVLSKLIKLWKLDLHGNPLSYKQKYHDRVVTMCHRLGEYYH